MRWVTAKPPNMLIAVSDSPRREPEDQRVGPSGPHPSGGATWTSMPPMAMMLLIALVTLISGVCSAGLTFQITM